MRSVQRISIASPTEWRDLLETMPAPHFLQTWEWGMCKARYGWQVARYVWYTGNGNTTTPCALASVLTRRMAGGLTGVMYVPKGPLFQDETNAVLREAVLSDLEAMARRARVLFVKIDPDIQADTPTGEALVTQLRARGWHPSEEQIQFRNTMEIDLRPLPDNLLAGMKSKWRYNIRLAMRKGVVVRAGGVDDLPILYRLYAETALRDGFVIRPEAYYRYVWQTFIAAGMAVPLIAEVNEQPVAMVILFRCGQRAWYVYGASANRHREKMPNHLLQWEAIQWAREQGCTIYDLWGAPDRPDESDPMWGVYRFKQGFGARLVSHIGAWDFPTSRHGYWLYTRVMPAVLAGMRRLYWRRAREANSAS